MLIFGIVLSVVAFVIMLFMALGLNQLDEERAAYYRERDEVRTDLWFMSGVGMTGLWFIPLAPLLLTDVFDHVNLFSWGPGLIWTAIVVASFLLSRHFIFRPWMKRVDERRAQK